MNVETVLMLMNVVPRGTEQCVVVLFKDTCGVGCPIILGSAHVGRTYGQETPDLRNYYIKNYP